MIEIYLEELMNACEDIEESKDYPLNLHAKTLRKERYDYCKEMIDKILEWLDERVHVHERR